MKRFITLLIITLPILVSGQDVGIFRIYYKPDKLYTSKSEAKSETRMSLQGDKAVIDKINQGSTHFPMTVQTLIITQTSSSTGSATTGNIVPIKFIFQNEQTKIIFNGNVTTQTSPLNGQSIDGLYTNKNTFIPNSKSLNGLDENKKQRMLKVLEMSQNQIIFPEKKLKIGDIFLQNNPMDIPISGFTPIQCTIVTTFKLIDTINTVAHFDISQIIKLDKSDPKFTVELSGTGTGSAEYDIKNKFLLNQITKSKIQIKIKLPNVDMILDLDNDINQFNKIK